MKVSNYSRKTSEYIQCKQNLKSEEAFLLLLADSQRELQDFASRHMKELKRCLMFTEYVSECNAEYFNTVSLNQHGYLPSMTSRRNSDPSRRLVSDVMTILRIVMTSDNSRYTDRVNMNTLQKLHSN